MQQNPEVKFRLHIRMTSIVYQLLLKLVIYIFLEFCISERNVNNHSQLQIVQSLSKCQVSTEF